VLEFAQTTYEAGSKAAGWPPELDVFGALASAVEASGGDPERLAPALEALLGVHAPVEEVAARMGRLEAAYRVERPAEAWPVWCARRLASGPEEDGLGMAASPP
jgi:hypothetical protein